MSSAWTRRSFVRSLVGLPATGLLACDGRGGGAPAPARSDRTVLSRPIVRPRGADAVWISSPASELPVAYVSMTSRQVFVDPDLRDRASWLLDAHISVSTWVWRIPLPGDSPLTPIPPGDERREFEELPIGAWDPSIEPAEGDIRILRGEPTTVSLQIGCAPVQGTTDFLSGPDIEIERADGGPSGTTREDFGAISSGRRVSDRECVGEGRTVRILAWRAPG